MDNMFSDKSQNKKSTGWLLIILIGYELAAVFMFNFLGLMLLLPFYDFDLQTIVIIFGKPMAYPDAKMPMLILLGVSALGTFIITPAWVVHKYAKIELKKFITTPKYYVRAALITIVLIISFSGVNTIVIEWNKALELPTFLSEFEHYVQEQEIKLAELTEFLTEFDNTGHFLLCILVIAIIPAVGEEFLFRGVLQNILRISVKNPHIAIWASALIFSIFHNQFYGLVPRMLLGAIFGYLYYWSGSLFLPVLGHFINNGLSLVLMFLFQKSLISFDLSGGEMNFNIYILLIFFIFTICLLYILRKIYAINEKGLAKSF
tara:strand:+ start:4080 stop:5033 length:954 start_codon:yes stop_codon:yes gene_type:complete